MGMAMIAASLAAAAQANVTADAEQVAAALQKAGYKAQIASDKDGDPTVKSAANGANFTIYFYGCTDHKACKSIQFTTDYTLKSKITIDKLNEWNATKRWVTAYADKDGNPCLQMDVNLDLAGTSDALFADDVDWWTTMMGSFQKFIGY
jgi:uncharacterized metal-binding protein